MQKVIENRLVDINVGDVLKLDCGVYKTLKESKWERGQFSYDDPVFDDRFIHVNLEISGRTFQSKDGDYWVRVKITWVNDGEPDTNGYGWVKVNPWQCELIN